MKKFLTIVLASFALMSFAQKTNNGSASNEPAVIKWIEDKPGPSFQQHRTFPTVPDDLWNQLGFKDGIPSSISCFLLKTEGKTILLDTGLGAGFSQLIPKLAEDNIKPEDLKLIYITHMHGDHIGGVLPGGVKSIAAYGHTPGHTAFQKNDILVIGDLMHGAALQLKHPEYNASFDMDQKAAAEARARLIKYARENKLTMYGMHLPSPGNVK